jgi:two-component system, OmpR family, response regulator ChvI
MSDKDDMKKNEVSRHGHRHRILVVDDEKDITFFLKEALESYGGFEVVTFNDPLVALSSLKNKADVKAFDLILLDIKMPRMDGFELYQELQKKIEHAHGHDCNDANKTKICFMTAFEVYYEALKELFPDSYSSVCFIKKPSSAKDLVERINKEIG